MTSRASRGLTLARLIFEQTFQTLNLCLKPLLDISTSFASQASVFIYLFTNIILCVHLYTRYNFKVSHKTIAFKNIKL